MNNRSISYVVGARGDFLSNYLWNTTPTEAYVHQGYQYVKFHTGADVSKHHPSIFIDYDLNSNEMITFFMWDKNIKSYFKSHTVFEEFTKIYFTMLTSWQARLAMRNNKFTHTLNFDNLFDEDYMINFFQQVNGRAPRDRQIEFLRHDNQKQQDSYNQKIKLHPARIAHKIFNFEQIHGLTKQQRLWSVVELWKHYQVPSDEFLNSLDNYLDLQHYNI